MANICIIEDDQSLRSTLVDLFECHGFSVISYDNGKSIDDILQHHTINALILDLSLNGENGMDILAKIRSQEEFATLPIIIITADVTFERKVEGLSQGATDYLHKPFSINELLLRIKNLIALRDKITRQVIDNSLIENQHFKRKGDHFFQTIDNYLLKNLNNAIDIDDMAKHCNMSRSSLDKVMRKTARTTPALYIRSYKVKQAKRFLAEDYGSVTEVAYLCGFRSLSYFSTSFKLVTGKSPKAFKK